MGKSKKYDSEKYAQFHVYIPRGPMEDFCRQQAESIQNTPSGWIFNLIKIAYENGGEIISPPPLSKETKKEREVEKHQQRKATEKDLKMLRAFGGKDEDND